MAPRLAMTKPEAVYTIDYTGGAHFMIDCACGGKSSSNYRNGSPAVRHVEQRGCQEDEKHTFYANTEVLLTALYYQHRQSKRQSPLIVICNSCRNEFPLYHETLLAIDEELKTLHKNYSSGTS